VVSPGPGAVVLGLLLAVAPSSGPLESLQLGLDPPELYPGAPLRIRLHGLPGDARATGRLQDEDLTFMPAPGGGLVAFAGVDLDVPPGDLSLTISLDAGGVGRKVERRLAVLSRDYPTEELKVAPKYVNPPPEVSERIAREAADLAELWDAATPRALYDGATVRPLPEAAGRNFGRRRVFNGEPRSAHSGTDLSAASGTPVPAAARGRVVRARDYYYSGNLVVLDHGGGVYTLYAHLSRIDVAEGDLVAAGDVLGTVGATGRVTGAHLHWGGRIGRARVDPAVLLELLSAGP
jgi:hypothetical protein